MNFGDVLRALLEERNITQKRLAADLNMAPSTIGGYVQNKSEPDFKTLKRLAKYFDVTTDYLLDYQSGNTNNHQEDEILRIFRSLTDVQKILYIGQGQVFVDANKKGLLLSDFSYTAGYDNEKKKPDDK